MKKAFSFLLAALVVLSFAVCSSANDADITLSEVKEKLRAQYGENKQITDGNYDKSLAVKCVNGTFVGKKIDDVIAYKGIPFVGRQPVGELRWKAPVDVVPSDGVYEAYYNAKSAYGNENLETGSLYYQDENCLYLNVWKADEESAEKKPVMVWIHGGAFEAGGTVDPMFDCRNFVKENPDVIVVTIAYRLGVFGFLHLSHLPDGKDYPDAQNLGLMDQLMALKWVHENIASFGGDPDNVTIFGESAGAASTTLLPLLKGSHAYFKRVIAQSGSPTQTRSTEEAIGCTNELIDALGCKTVAELQKIDAQKLMEASALLFLRQFPERDGIHLPLDTYKAYADGAAKDIVFLQGCNKDEMDFFVYSFGVENFQKWADDRKTRGIVKLSDEEKKLIESFCNDIKGESYEQNSRLFSQSWFNAPLIRFSENQTKAGGKAYVYYFRVESSVPIMNSGHSIELSTVFNHPDMNGDTGRTFDATFSKTLRKMWVQFAKTGSPSLSADISPDGKTHVWPLYDLKNREVMVFDEFDIHTEKESELKIVDRDRTYFLTKYYMLLPQPRATAAADSAGNAPDYSQKASWYRIPNISKDVDTFYIYATEYVMDSFKEGAPEYAPLDNAETLQGVDGQYTVQASAYDASTNVFVPYYRQAGMLVMKKAWLETGNVDAAISGIPYSDITAALDYYFENYNNGRPFILAGHSQGSVIARLLLKKYFKEHPDYYKRMVAAYIIGYSVTKDDLEAFPYLKFATGESDTGVIVSWNTEGKKNSEENAKTAVLLPNAISINPLNWKRDETYAPASENLGSLVLDEKTGEIKVADIGADAQINLARGVVVTNAKAEQMPEAQTRISAEFFGADGRHDSDYTFYYNNIKDNAVKRVAAYMAGK